MRPSASHTDGQPAPALADALAGLASHLTDLHARADPRGHHTNTTAALAGPDAAPLQALLEAEAAIHPGLDRKAQAAFLIGRAARSIVYPLAGLLMLQSVVPRMTPYAVALRPERYRWEHDGKTGEAIRYVAHFDPDTSIVTGAQAELHAAFHDAIVATMSPVVAALRRAAGLSPGALWRLVTDMVCVAFLNVGEQRDDVPAAQTHALAVTRREGSPLNNRVSGFQHVTLPDAADADRILAQRWFITRGGCCRWYTHPEGEHCSVCVLLKPEEQQEKLRDYLRRTHEATA